MGKRETVIKFCSNLVHRLWWWLALHLAVSALCTVLVRRYALHHNLIDLPGERRSHIRATPRGGGLGIVVALCVGGALASYYRPDLRWAIALTCAGLILVASIGWLDDHRSLSVRPRLVVHAAASILLSYVVYTASQRFSYCLLSFFASMVLINIWNFMDGINGLAVSQAGLVAFAYAWVLPSPYNYIGYAVTSACAGFLPYNFPRARIFLGDCGSGALGYLLSVCFAACVVNAKITLWTSWFPMTAFLCDAGLTLCNRMWAKQAWWKPHTQHLYQRAAFYYQSHSVVTGIYFVFSLISGYMFINTSSLQYAQSALISISWSIMASVLWAAVRRKLIMNKD